MTGANVNDGKRLEEVLRAIVVRREAPPARRSKHLSADAGYRSAQNFRVIEQHGYIAHGVDRRHEVAMKRRDPRSKARRWVVEVSHSWFNRFRKLLVRYEKLERSFVALNHLAAAIIAFRKVPSSVNIICALEGVCKFKWSVDEAACAPRLTRPTLPIRSRGGHDA